MTFLSRLLPTLGLLLVANAWSQSPFSVHPDRDRPLVPNNRWALVVGVSDYLPEIGPLRYTAHEARLVSTTLTSQLQFAPENVTTLTDGGPPSEAPTSNHVLAALDGIVHNKRLDKANLFVFYFSGHGAGTASGDYLLPSDTHSGQYETAGVPVRAIISKIVHAGLKNVLFIADACRAGTKNDFGTELVELCHQANIAVILGCAPGKRSYEYRELKQGAFTHFLLQALQKPELRDASGALWASQIGRDVQTETYNFTKQDKGKNAQLPTVWGDSSTLDVLLAAYPTSLDPSEGVRQFQARASRLTAEGYTLALQNYAFTMFDKGRIEETIELLKTADQLGNIGAEAKCTLAASLDEAGRTGEAQKFYRSIQTESGGYWSDLAILASSSREQAPRFRAAACQRMFNEAPGWLDKLAAVTAMDACGTYDQRRSLSKSFGDIAGATKRQKYYAAGHLDLIKGRWHDAVVAFNKAKLSPGADPEKLLIFTGKLDALTFLKDEKALEAHLRTADPSGPMAGIAFLRQAQLAKDRGEVPARLEALRMALKQGISPAFILSAAQIAGPHLMQLEPEFRAAVKLFPFAWRAQFVLAVLNQASGDSSAKRTADLTAAKFMDDDLTVNATVFSYQYEVLTEALALGTIKEDFFVTQMEDAFLSMMHFAPHFGSDAKLWLQLAQYGMASNRGAQVDALINHFQPTQTAGASRELRALLFLVALNRGDWSSVDRTEAAGFEPAEGNDPAWLYACSLAARGRIFETTKSIQKLGPPSSSLKPLVDAFRTYLIARAGRPGEARTLLKKQGGDLIEQAYAGLSWASIGDWKQAEPLLSAQTESGSWPLLFVQAEALDTLNRYYHRMGILEYRDLAFYAQLEQPGNRLFDSLSFCAKPGIGQFAGTTNFSATVVDDLSPSSTGPLKIVVDSVGKVTGTYTSTEGVVYNLKGIIDEHGNMKGAFRWGGRVVTLSAKLAPARVYQTYKLFRSAGQAIQLVDQSGYRILLIAQKK